MSNSISLIPCHCCGREFPSNLTWYVCDKCGYRICPFCLTRHKGRYGAGLKCSQCAFGLMRKRDGF